MPSAPDRLITACDSGRHPCSQLPWYSVPGEASTALQYQRAASCPLTAAHFPHVPHLNTTLILQCPLQPPTTTAHNSQPVSSRLMAAMPNCPLFPHLGFFYVSNSSQPSYLTSQTSTYIHVSTLPPFHPSTFTLPPVPPSICQLVHPGTFVQIPLQQILLRYHIYKLFPSCSLISEPTSTAHASTSVHIQTLHTQY